LDIHGGGGISPYLLQPRNQWADVIKAIAPAVREYLDKKRNDEIANDLLSSENARRAEPVLSNGQYVSGGPGMDARGVADYNASLGYFGTYATPQLGGARALFLARQQQALDDKRQEDAMKATDWEQRHRQRELEMWKMTQPDSREPRYPMPLPDGRTVMVTGNEALRSSRERPTKSDNDWAHSYPLARGKIDDLGEFTNQYSDAQNGPMLELRKPDGTKLVVPYSEYQEWSQKQKHSLGSQLYKDLIAPPDEASFGTHQPLQWSDSSVEPSMSKPPKPTTKAEYDALPHGALYYAPDGKQRRKP